MANHKSAKKANRQTQRRTLVNKSRMSNIRSLIRKVEEAIAGGDKIAARQALQDAQPKMARGANRGLLHWNTVSRKMSRLNARIKALAS